MAQFGLSEEAYQSVAEWRTYDGYSDAERIGIEYAEKFALAHTELDDAFFERMKKHYDDEEIMEIAVSVGTWLTLGRITMVMGASTSCPIELALSEG